MRELVEKFGFGVSIDDDGNSIEKIVDGIKEVDTNYEGYHKNILKNRHNLLWENQESVFCTIIDKLLK